MIRDPIRKNVEADEFVRFYCWAELPPFQITKFYEFFQRVLTGNIFWYIQLNNFYFTGHCLRISLPYGQRFHRDSECV